MGLFFRASFRLALAVTGRVTFALALSGYDFDDVGQLDDSLTEPRIGCRPSAAICPRAFAAASSSTTISSPITRCPAASGTRCGNAHHLRELKALIDIDKEQWAGQMRDLLLDQRRDRPCVRHARHPQAYRYFPEQAGGRPRGGTLWPRDSLGGDSDGTLGVKAIKERGGMTLAQVGDGFGPRYPDMPRKL